MADTPTVTRRRVLVGAAWATPMVLVATAVPAAAASGAMGAIALAQTSAAMTATTLYVRAMLTYGGYTGPNPDAPVTTVRAEFTVLTNRITTTTPPTFTGAGWTYAGRTSAGSGSSATSTFTFTWTGADLSATNLATTQLVAQIPKPNSQNNLTVTMAGRGVSNAVAVPPATGSATVLNVGVMAFGVGAANRVTYQASFTPIGGGGSFAAYRLRPQARNTGVAASGSRRVAEDIVGVTALVEVPAANTTGARYDRLTGSVGAGWTLTSGPTLTSGVWSLTYSYTGALARNASSTTIDFMLRALGAKTLNCATITVNGTSAGVPVTVSHVGPVS